MCVRQFLQNEPYMSMLKEKILVLGGKTGMLGQALVKGAIARGYEVETLGREDGDILDYEFLKEKIQQINPQIVFNAIAYTAVDKAEEDEQNASAVNKRLPEMLACILKGTSVFLVHYSTDFVFGGKQYTPYTEKDEPCPLSVYGATKLAGEQALAKLENCAILRTAWLFGEGRKNFVSTILKYAQEKNSLLVVADQFGSPTYTKDLAEMTFLVLKNHGTGIFHAVNSGQASWCELASEAVKILNLHVFVEPIETKDWPQKAVRPAYSVLSTQKLTQMYGYSPRPWVQALQEYIFENMNELKQNGEQHV